MRTIRVSDSTQISPSLIETDSPQPQPRRGELLVRVYAAGVTSKGAVLVSDTEHAARLQELLATEAEERIILDLKDVSLVDRAAVRFLARVEAAGTQIINCPEYLRLWIAAGDDGR